MANADQSPRVREACLGQLQATGLPFLKPGPIAWPAASSAKRAAPLASPCCTATDLRADSYAQRALLRFPEGCRPRSAPCSASRATQTRTSPAQVSLLLSGY